MSFQVRPLPEDVQQLLHTLQAPPRLVAHLTLVHDVAGQLCTAWPRYWPQVAVDQEAVLLGAATHDAGKVRYPEELNGPGTQHETIGPSLLIAHGIPAQYARFAQTHGTWQQTTMVNIEDLLVALADTIWKGKRNEDLELRLAGLIADVCSAETWQVYMQLDELITRITEDADKRLAWQERSSKNGGRP
ncbi:MAG TPA: HD domain-containing protein [Chloroflexia bacterium]|nr:HD domain-containing protein [Chloroflexia bacterium]